MLGSDAIANSTPINLCEAHIVLSVAIVGTGLLGKVYIKHAEQISKHILSWNLNEQFEFSRTQLA